MFNFWWLAGLVDGLKPHLPPLSSQKNEMHYVQPLMIGRVIQATNSDWNAKKGPLSHQKWNALFWIMPNFWWSSECSPQVIKNEMFIFGLRSTSDDWLSNPSNEQWLKCGKRPPKSSKNEMLIFGLCSTSDDQPSNPSKKCWPKCKKMKKAP